MDERQQVKHWMVTCVAVAFAALGALALASMLFEQRPATRVLSRPQRQPWQRLVLGLLLLPLGARLRVLGQRMASTERARREVAPQGGQAIERVLPGPDGAQRIVVFRRASGTFGFRVERFADDPLERAWIPVPGYGESFTGSADAAADEALARVRRADPGPADPRAAGR